MTAVISSAGWCSLARCECFTQSRTLVGVADRAVTEYLDVRAHIYLNTAGLEVLGVGSRLQRSRQIERADLVKAFERLRHHYSMVPIDCGNSVKSGAVPAALRRSRAIVVINSATAPLSVQR